MCFTGMRTPKTPKNSEKQLLKLPTRAQAAWVLNQQYFQLTLTMRVVHLLSLAFAGFVTWLAAFSFKCYYRGWSEIPSKHPRDHVAPYPGGTNDNIFWFLQVHTY